MTMTDRELLERAAKAAGISGDVSNDGTHWFSLQRGTKRWWNPLTDDGDALRLAVKLRLNVMQGLEAVDVNDEADISELSLRGEDPCAATRRAIVRAAAAMAKED